MNDQGLKESVDAMHLEVMNLDIKSDISKAWWKVLHHILELEHLNNEDEKRKHLDIRRCKCDDKRMCTTELYCTYWKNVLEKGE